MASATVADDAVWSVLSGIPDPEIPVLTLTDLGVIRWVRSSQHETVVGVAPTYSGCPATEVIEASVVDALHENVELLFDYGPKYWPKRRNAREKARSSETDV